MSYPVSGNVRDFIPEGFPIKKPIIPHGSKQENQNNQLFLKFILF